jgi:hypothetical protein
MAIMIQITPTPDVKGTESVLRQQNGGRKPGTRNSRERIGMESFFYKKQNLENAVPSV